MGQLEIIADLKWGLATDDVDDINMLPPDFAKAKELWADGRINEAGALLSPYLACLFMKSNMTTDPSELVIIDEEQPASRITIYGVDFSEYNIPNIRASASFNCEVENPISEEEFNTWQEENDFFDNAISFGWSIETDDDELSFEITHFDSISVSINTNGNAN